MSLKRRALAAPFVVTFALGCQKEPEPIHGNPPYVPPVPTIEPAAVDAGAPVAASASAASDSVDAAPPPVDAGASGSLPKGRAIPTQPPIHRNPPPTSSKGGLTF